MSKLLDPEASGVRKTYLTYGRDRADNDAVDEFENSLKDILLSRGDLGFTLSQVTREALKLQKLEKYQNVESIGESYII